jgi:hypothetical protein
MSLTDIYSNKVKRGSINSLSVGTSFPSMETRDPTIDRLQQNLMAKLKEIMPQEPEPVRQPTPQTVQSFSFADAVKELIEMKNKQ